MKMAYKCEDKMEINFQDIPYLYMLLAGFLIGLGVLIALPDDISNRITARDNLGWVLLTSGILIIVGWVLVPFLPVLWDAIVLMWQRSSATMLIAFAIGVILIAIGAWNRR